MCTMYYVLCAATIERYGRQGLNMYIYIYTAYHSKLGRPWWDILIGYNSLHIDPRIKSMGCFEKFMKFSVW